ncbi:MAG: hypothetical protein JNL90_00920 [Planctomycetes bacterium]|nr:hypothetical protein [Planctomycetota bacterium]
MAPPAPAAPARQDASKQEIALPAAAGWNATLVHDNDVGIWTCGTLDAFEMNGAQEAFGLDDKGRCILLSSYSGKWTPWPTVEDHEWLGAIAQVELDPRRPERELYTGGKRGNLYQIVVHRDGTMDTARIAAFPAEELHTAVAGDLDPTRPGQELLLFTHLGNVYEPRARSGGFEFDVVKRAQLAGRVRQALVLPSGPATAPWIAGVCRTGEVLLMRAAPDDGLEVRELLKEPMGFGRIARRKSAPGEREVLYVTRDDGVVLRLEAKGAVEGEWTREVIYAGPQGPRGIAAGRFDPDPAVETVAVFGYSARVELLSRRAGEMAWTVEVLFEERDKGHWLEAVEVDGRNGTDELMGSGYGARIFLLSRPPGTGLPGAAVNPRPENGAPPPANPPANAASAAAAKPTAAVARSGASSGALRVAIRGKPGPAEAISPLAYRGGFDAKTTLYETLVRIDENGRVAPALASSWAVAPDGKAVTLELREGARFHDGTPVEAAAVALHFKRWLGLPEHAWLRNARHVTAVVVDDARHLTLRLAQPAAVLVDLCAINPCAIRGPGALDGEGNPVAPIGSGPYRCVGTAEGDRTLRFERWDERGGAPSPSTTAAPRTVADAAGGDAASRVERLELVRFGADESPIDALLAGEVDVVADGWQELVPRERLEELRGRDDLEIVEAPGSSVWYLAARAGVDADECNAVKSALDRAALIATCEAGFADPCDRWAAPSVAMWPLPRGHGPMTMVPPNGQPLDGRFVAGDGPHDETRDGAPGDGFRLLVHAESAREQAIAEQLDAQLLAKGYGLIVRALAGADYDAALAAGEFEFQLESTWGVPYDPWLSLFDRFLPPPADEPGATSATLTVPAAAEDPVRARLSALVERAAACTDPAAMEALAPEIELSLRDAVVPLYSPRRIAVVRRGCAQIVMGADLYRTAFRAAGSGAR